MSRGVTNLGGPQGFWVYILASARNGTLYIGHTDNLHRRLDQHRNGVMSDFAFRYGCKTLVWAEWHETRHGPSNASAPSRRGSAPGSCV